jgi:hypothetical protein
MATPDRTPVQVGALAECADSDDLCLADSFGKRAGNWRASTVRPSASGSRRRRFWLTWRLHGCSSHDVAAVTCGDCEARLFEARVDA